MREFVLKCYRNSVIRYVFFGGCTTMVNLITFYLFRYVFQIPLNPANLLSIILAILFAYVVNSRYVFQEPCHGFDLRRQVFRGKGSDYAFGTGRGLASGGISSTAGYAGKIPGTVSGIDTELSVQQIFRVYPWKNQVLKVRRLGFFDGL